MDEINSLSFIKARSAELEDLEASLKNSTKKTMLFQRLPFHKRRRTSSYERKRSRKPSKPHTWLAKRFRMVFLYGARIPIESNHKSDSYVYKSQKRGLIFNEGYKKAKVYEFIKNYEGIDYSIINSVQICVISGERVEVIVSYPFLIIIQISDKDLIKASLLFEFDKIFIQLKGCLRLTGKYENEELVENISIEDYIRNKDENGYLFIKYYFCSMITGVILARSKIMCDYFTKKGFVVIGIKEVLRVALENKELFFPFDYPTSSLFKEYEAVLIDPIKSKYDRTPLAKKKVLKLENFYLPIENILSIWCFECLKGGSLERSASIYSDDDVLVGYILRCAFSYTIGRCGGVCYLIKEDNGRLWGRNSGSLKKYEIKLMFKSEDLIN